MGLIKNLPQSLRGIELRMARAKDMARDQYRAFVWQVFLRILRETPQYSGRGVAHWNLSIGSPNFTTYSGLGDDATKEPAWDPRYGMHAKGIAAHERGDERWERVARNRARPIKDRIFLKDKVFISNGVKGDGDDVGAELYMQALQDPGYWVYKLRQVNKDYEVAQESMIAVAMKWQRKGGTMPPMWAEEGQQK